MKCFPQVWITMDLLLSAEMADVLFPLQKKRAEPEKLYLQIL